MKKIIITTVFIGSFLISAQAQFLMKNNTHILRAGDEHYFNITNNVNPGESGQYQNWDFSNLETKSTLTSHMYSVFNSKNSANIPEANTILEEFGVEFYFKTSAGKIEQYGTVTKNNTITKFDEPFVKMVFPFNYGDTYAGNFSGTIEGANNYKSSFIGTYLLEADAFGTLTLPGNITYKNVFRIKTTKEQCNDKSNSCNCATISYKWYSHDVRYPLLTIIQNKTVNGVKTFRTAYYSKINEEVNQKDKPFSLGNESIKIKVYPNPFTKEFKVDYTILKNSDIQIAIYDNSGRKVNSIYKLNQTAGNYTEIINSKHIGNQLGLFHIRIIAGDEVVSKTIVRGEK